MADSTYFTHIEDVEGLKKDLQFFYRLSFDQHLTRWLAMMLLKMKHAYLEVGNLFKFVLKKKRSYKTKFDHQTLAIHIASS